VKKCLAKDPEDRWQNAADLGSELKWIAEAGSQAGVPAPLVAKRKDRERIAWIGFAAAALAAVGFAYGFVRRAPEPRPLIRSSLAMPEKVSLAMLALSPDGRSVAFTGADTQGRSALWVRPLGAEAAQLVPGTENATFPFWSPDSRSIAFFADRRLKRVDASGGSVLTVAELKIDPVGGSWGSHGDVLVGQGGGPIMRVPASGGNLAPASRLDASLHETSHRYPFFLPDGRHFLYLALNLAGTPEDRANQVCAGSLDSTEVRRVIRGYSNPIYASEHLLLARDGDLVAQPFSPARLRTEGDPATVAKQVGVFFGYIALGQFSASDSGLLALAGSNLVPTRLQWVDRSGRVLSSAGDAALYGGVRVSPDGRRAAVAIFEPNIGKAETWIVDLSSGAKTRFTSGPSENFFSIWSPDGARIAFSSDRSHQDDLFEKAVGGGVDERPLLEAEGQKLANDWSPDGRYILYFDREPQGQRAIGLSALPLFGDRKPLTVVPRGRHNNIDARFSPDGSWIAYEIDDGGRPEIYVTDFPAAKARWQVSTEGGLQPRWRRDGRELFYVAPDGKLMSVAIEPGRSFQAGVPKLLFETLTPWSAGPSFYDIAADGQKFLMNLPPNQSAPPLSLIVNWTAALKR